MDNLLHKDRSRILKERMESSFRTPQVDDSLQSFKVEREAKVLSRLDNFKQFGEFVDDRLSMTLDFVAQPTVKDVVLQKSEVDLRKVDKLHVKKGDIQMNHIVKKADSSLQRSFLKE